MASPDWVVPPPAVLGTRGLANLGNTCYFNAALQCLGRTRPLRRALRSMAATEPELLAACPLTRTLWFTLQALSARTPGGDSGSSVSSDAGGPPAANGGGGKKKGGGGGGSGGGGFNPSELLNAVRRVAPQFKGSSQQDSHELVVNLLSGCDEEMVKLLKARAKGKGLQPEESDESGDSGDSDGNEEESEDKEDPTAPPPVYESCVGAVFGCTLWNVVTCGGCGFESLREERALGGLSLDIPGATVERGVSALDGLMANGRRKIGGRFGAGAAMGSATKKGKHAAKKAEAEAKKKEGKKEDKAAKEAAAIEALLAWEGKDSKGKLSKGAKGAKAPLEPAKGAVPTTKANGKALSTKELLKAAKATEKEAARAKKLAGRKGATCGTGARTAAAALSAANGHGAADGGGEEAETVVGAEEVEGKEAKWVAAGSEEACVSAAASGDALAKAMGGLVVSSEASAAASAEASAVQSPIPSLSPIPISPSVANVSPWDGRNKGVMAALSVDAHHAATASSSVVKPAVGGSCLFEDEEALIAGRWLRLSPQEKWARAALRAAAPRLPAPTAPLSAAAAAAAGTITLEQCLRLFTSPVSLDAKGGNGFRCPACAARQRRADATAAAATTAATTAAVEGEAADNTSASPVCANIGASDDGSNDDDEPLAPMKDASHRIVIGAPPEVLVLHVKRLFPFHKVATPVRAPPTLDLAPFCLKEATGDQAAGSAPVSTVYSLYGITEHSGGASGGHYVAVTSGAGGTSNGAPLSWDHCSDSVVRAVDEATALASQTYMLWYARTAVHPAAVP